MSDQSGTPESAVVTPTIPDLRSDAFIRRVLTALEDAAFSYLEDYLRLREVAIRLEVSTDLHAEKEKLEVETRLVKRSARRSQKRVDHAVKVVRKFRSALQEVKDRIDGILGSPEDIFSEVVAQELESIVELIDQVGDLDADRNE